MRLHLQGVLNSSKRVCEGNYRANDRSHAHLCEAFQTPPKVPGESPSKRPNKNTKLNARFGVDWWSSFHAYQLRKTVDEYRRPWTNSGFPQARHHPHDQG